jgi:hypothetical protein
MDGKWNLDDEDEFGYLRLLLLLLDWLEFVLLSFPYSPHQAIPARHCPRQMLKERVEAAPLAATIRQDVAAC